MKQRLRSKNQLYISRKKSSLRAYSYKIGASALHPCGPRRFAAWSAGVEGAPERLAPLCGASLSGAG